MRYSVSPISPCENVPLILEYYISTEALRRQRPGSSRQDEAELLPSPDRGRGRQPGGVVVDVPFRPAVEQLVERDPALQTRQVRPEAVVHALAEGDVRDVVAVDVECVGFGVSAGAAVGGAEQQQHRAAGRHGGAVALEVARHPPGDMRTGRLE